MCPQERKLTIEDVQDDWRILDQPAFAAPAAVRLISHESFTRVDDFRVERITPGILAGLLKKLPRVRAFFYAIRLLGKCGSDAVLILNGGEDLWIMVGLLNRFPWVGKRRVLCWDVFVETGRSAWKQRLMRSAMRGMSLSVVWSKAQVDTHAEYLGLPRDRFIFLPYKANHSKGPHYEFPVGRFVFAGGNGKRDYRCLVDAVRGTGIPVIISATDPEVRSGIEELPNVIALAAREPAFAQLQAASRFVVVPMTYTGLKGGGEANFCNGMWHGKPVIASDSIAANDYILEGETGYVVAAGDAGALRERIIELWNDPVKVEEMGKAGRRHVERWFTHEAFIRRLLRLAEMVGSGGSIDSVS